MPLQQRAPEEALETIHRSVSAPLLLDFLVWLEPFENTELATVALLVLGSVQDKATVPLAQRLRKSPLTSDAAEAFLDAMQAAPP